MGDTALKTRIDSGPSTTGLERRGCYDPGIQETLIDLTRAFTFAMLDGSGKANARLFVPDGVFIGGFIDKDRGGVDAYRRFNETIASRDLRIVLARRSIVAHPLGWDECLIMGDFHLFLGEGRSSTPVISKPIRLVYDWCIIGDEPRLRYLEISFPLTVRDLPTSLASSVSEGPNAVGMPLGEVFEERLLEVHDPSRTTLLFGTDDILCIEADGRRSRIHLRNDTVPVTENIGTIERLLSSEDGDPSPFIRVHRTFLINGWHLRSISADGAVLDDGTVVPVSARRLSQIRSDLRDLHRSKTLSVNEIARIVRQAMAQG